MARKPRTYGYRTVKEARAVLAQAKREGRFQPTKPIREYRGENVRRIARTLESNPQVKSPQELRDIARGRAAKTEHLKKEGKRREQDVVRPRKDGTWRKRDLLKALDRYPGPGIAVAVRGDILLIDLDNIETMQRHYGARKHRDPTEDEPEYDYEEDAIYGALWDKGEVRDFIERYSRGDRTDEIELARELAQGENYRVVTEITFAQGQMERRP